MARHFLASIVERSSGWQLVNTRTKRVVADHIETAFDSAARRRGLLGRTTLPDGFALVIAPCNAVHTFGMQTAIDVLFVRRDGCVAKCKEAVPPRRITGALRGFATLELAPGALARAGGVLVGDVLQLHPRG